VHYAGGYDPYEAAYWSGDVARDFAHYLEQTLRCVQMHKDYDVLGHLTYVCKSVHNPSHAPVQYEKHREITDAILQEHLRRGNLPT
jgi:histidinol phosphatase-like PHP family hydrolase